MKKILLLLVLFYTSITYAQDNYNEEYEIKKVVKILKEDYKNNASIYRSIGIKEDKFEIYQISKKNGYTVTYSMPIEKIDINSIKFTKKNYSYFVILKSKNKEKIGAYSLNKNQKLKQIYLKVNSKSIGKEIAPLIKKIVQSH